MIPSPRKLAESWYCNVGPLPNLPVLSRFIEFHLSYTVIQSYSRTSGTFIQSYVLTSYTDITIHSYINTFTYSYTSYTQHQFKHGCISHPKSCLVVSLQFGPHSSLCQAAGSTNEQLAITSFSSKSVIPSVSGQEMSLINHFKWQVLTNEQLKPFQMCHPQCVWPRDVTNKSFQVASPKQRTAWVYLYLVTSGKS